MEILIAITHILGSQVAILVLSVLTLHAFAWVNTAGTKKVFEEVSISLGIKVEDLDNIEHTSKIIKFLSDRFSIELLQNRLSDFFGSIQTLWDWLSRLSRALVLLAVIWGTVTENLDNAIYAWNTVGIWLFFWLMIVILSISSKILTGRFPGQAKQARKAGAELMERLERETI